MEKKASDALEMAAKANEKGKEKEKGQIDSSVSSEKLEKYFALTKEALEKVKAEKFKDPNNIDLKKVLEDFIDMADRYYQDALHFRKKNDFVTAFASLNYAHGFLDAAARLGVLSIKDSRLFASD